MPSLQDALNDAMRKAMETPPATTTIPADWDDEGGAAKIEEVKTPKRMNISKETFYFVKDNPGLTRRQIMDAMSQRGFLDRTIGALLSTFLLQGMLRGAHNTGLYTVNDKYTPPKAHAMFRKRAYDTMSPAALMRKNKRLAKALKEQRKQVTVVPRDNTTAGLQKLAENKRVLVDVRNKTTKVVTEAAQPVPQVEPVKNGWSARDALDSLSVLQAREMYNELKKLFGDNK
jgi:hypothetical protein